MKVRRVILVCLALLLLGNAVVGYRAYSKDAKAGDTEKVFDDLAIMMQVLQLIRTNYVDAEQVSSDQLLTDAIIGMTASLDPFSEYMPPADLKHLNEQTQGSFGGVGIQVSMKNGFMTVITTIDDTPASRAGIMPNDQIVSVDGKDMTGVSSDGVLKLLRGEIGTKVTVGLKRQDVAEPIVVELLRARIPIHTVVNVHQIAGTKIGYIRVTEFSEPTPDALRKALQQLEGQRCTGLIIDLRNNPGGLLNSACEMCSMFLPEKKLIVSVEGRNPANNYKQFAIGGYKVADQIPVAILINGGSASAAEVMSSCLRDYRRAVLIGEKSFGKGSVQAVHNFPNGAGLKLTIAKYFTQSHTLIHGKGLQPDIVSVIDRDGYRKLYETTDQAKKDAIDLNIQAALKWFKDGAKIPEARAEPPAPAADKASRNKKKPPVKGKQ